MTLQTLLTRALIGLIGIATSTYLATEVANEITETFQPVTAALEQINEGNRP